MVFYYLSAEVVVWTQAAFHPGIVLCPATLLFGAVEMGFSLTVKWRKKWQMCSLMFVFCTEKMESIILLISEITIYKVCNDRAVQIL